MSASNASMVAVAQLVESRIVIPVVVGSSPISHPISSKELPNQAFIISLYFVLPIGTFDCSFLTITRSFLIVKKTPEKFSSARGRENTFII